MYFVHVLCFCVFCVKSMLLGCALRLQPLSIKYSSQLLNLFVLATKCTCLDLKIHLSKSCVSCWGHVTCMRLQPLPLMAIIKNKLNLKTSKPRSFSIDTAITENITISIIFISIIICNLQVHNLNFDPGKPAPPPLTTETPSLMESHFICTKKYKCKYI